MAVIEAPDDPCPECNGSGICPKSISEYGPDPCDLCNGGGDMLSVWNEEDRWDRMTSRWPTHGRAVEKDEWWTGDEIR